MIIRTPSGDVEYREASLAALLAAHEQRTGIGRTAGVAVTEDSVSGIPAVDDAVTQATEAVACLTMRPWTGDRTLPSPVTTGWQATFFSGQPNEMQSWFMFWEVIQASLEHRRNAFYWKSKARGRVFAMTALHPDQVTVERDRDTRSLRYHVRFDDRLPAPPEWDGRTSVIVGTDTVHHIRGRGGLGQILAPTPIEQFRTALGTSIAKYRHEAALLANGADRGVLIAFPPTTKEDEAQKWVMNFDKRNAGPDRAGKTKYIGGGATATSISMTQADAQFVESMGLSVLDISRIYHWPAWMLGAELKSAAPPTPEDEQTRLKEHYIIPRLLRIESSLAADKDLFPGTGIWPAFDASDIVRADLSTSDTIDHQRIQDGRLLVDEWRAARGLPPLPGGLGKIPQITPVGGAPNALQVTPTADSDDS